MKVSEWRVADILIALVDRTGTWRISGLIVLVRPKRLSTYCATASRLSPAGKPSFTYLPISGQRLISDSS